jgi:hypothetical protein
MWAQIHSPRELGQLHDLIFSGLKVLAALVLGLLVPSTANAHLGNFRPATWNMYGANQAGENQWNRDVNSLTRNHDVVALPEVACRQTVEWSMQLACCLRRVLDSKSFHRQDRPSRIRRRLE